MWLNGRKLRYQGSALRKITRSSKVPNYEIQGAQHKAYMKEIRLSGRPKAKVCCLRHPGTRAPLEHSPGYLSNILEVLVGKHSIVRELFINCGLGFLAHVVLSFWLEKFLEKFCTNCSQISPSSKNNNWKLKIKISGLLNLFSPFGKN